MPKELIATAPRQATLREYEERNLDADDSGEPIRHPDLDQVFSNVRDGVYVRRRGVN